MHSDDLERNVPVQVDDSDSSAASSDIEQEAELELADPEIHKLLRYLAHTHAQDLRRYDRSIDADDLMQEVSIRIVRWLRKGNKIDARPAFLREVLKNAFLNVIRKHRSKIRTVSFDDLREHDADEVADHYDAEKAQELKQLMALVEQSLDRMSSQERNVTFRRLNGEGSKSIGADLGLSIETVWSAERRGRKKIQDLIIERLGLSGKIALVVLVVLAWLFTSRRVADAAAWLSRAKRVARPVGSVAIIALVSSLLKMKDQSASYRIVEGSLSVPVAQATRISQPDARAQAGNTRADSTSLAASSQVAASMSTESTQTEAAPDHGTTFSPEMTTYFINSTFAAFFDEPQQIHFEGPWGPSQPLVLTMNQNVQGDGPLNIAVTPTAEGTQYQCAGVRRGPLALIQCARSTTDDLTMSAGLLFIGILHGGALRGNAWYGTEEQGYAAASAWTLGDDPMTDSRSVAWWTQLPVLPVVTYLCQLHANVPICAQPVGVAELVAPTQVRFVIAPDWTPNVRVDVPGNPGWIQGWAGRANLGGILTLSPAAQQGMRFVVEGGTILGTFLPQQSSGNRTTCGSGNGTQPGPLTICM